jgi:hypothetical protein
LGPAAGCGYKADLSEMTATVSRQQAANKSKACRPTRSCAWKQA